MEIKTIEGLMMIMSEYYDRKMSEDMAQLMVNDYKSEGLGVQEILRSWNIWRKRPNCVRMPTPGDLLSIAKPTLNPKDEAIRRLNLIKESVRKFGWPNPMKAKSFLGEVIWNDVLRMGGWKHLCENPKCNINDGMIYAQIRDSITSSVQAERAGIDYSAPAISGGKNEILSLVQDLSKRKQITGDKDES